MARLPELQQKQQTLESNLFQRWTKFTNRSVAQSPAGLLEGQRSRLALCNKSDTGEKLHEAANKLSTTLIFLE